MIHLASLEFKISRDFLSFGTIDTQLSRASEIQGMTASYTIFRVFVLRRAFTRAKNISLL